MMNPFVQSQWVTPSSEACQSPIIRRTFTVEQPANAVLFVTGLGYFEAKLNGEPVTRDLLIPLASDYERRNNYDTWFIPFMIHLPTGSTIAVTKFLIC